MTELFIQIIFLGNIAVLFMAFVQSHRMFYTFRDKYPEIARANISNAFEKYSDPSKLFFFFRSKNKQYLINDSEIWKLRQQTKYLLIIGIGLTITQPFIWFVVVYTSNL